MDDRASPRTATGLEIAIVGMAGRFPKSRGVEAFWRNLCAGVEGIRFFSDDEILAADPDLDPALLGGPGYVKARGVLDDAELFDAELFGYSPQEAELMDPQQRLFLECAWEALQDAGYDPTRHAGTVGVYGGVSLSTYVLSLLSRARALGFLEVALGNDKDYLATRVAYKLNLTGPSLTVQTACSSSLVAVHLACQGLLGGECDTALAGGVSVHFPQRAGYLHVAGDILSPDGRCRAFDAGAAGTASGQGVGLVVLRRLADALADGDDVRAVILGSAVNNDGADKVGFTAPRIEGQAKAIRTAQQIAEVDPESIAFVECHGTGTELGDRIEVAALTEVFRRRTEKVGFCALGAVKTNIGHLDAAAGIAGLVKAALAVGHGEIPPNLHFRSAKPELGLEGSPFYVPTELRPWPSGARPRRAGVSAFGLGGTNAHVVLEEAPAAPPAPASRPWQLVPLSARSRDALERLSAELAERLESRPDLQLPDVAYTTQVGRRTFSHRRALVCRDRESALGLLRGDDARRRLSAVYRDTGEPGAAFVFSGLGDHYVGMGEGLYRGEEVFRRALDEICDLFQPHLGLDLRELLYPEDASRDGGGADGAARLDLAAMVRGRPAAGGEAAGRLGETRWAQPVLFAVEFALAELWASWGVRPRAMAGYSLGEYVCACVAGVLSREDAALLVAERAERIHRLPAGAMMAVSLSEGEVLPRLGADLDLAAVNAPEVSVVAGPEEAVETLAADLDRDGVVHRRLRTSHAFHSRSMKPATADLRRILGRVSLSPPRLPYLSNVTGTWITAAEATDPEYWVEHLCRPVRFASALAELWREPGQALVEVGPGQSLTSLALQVCPPEEGRVAVPSLPHPFEKQEDQELALRGLGTLWLAGVDVDWRGLHGGDRRRRVPLPTTPFERRRYWIEPRREAGRGPLATPVDGKLPDMADWFYVPSWKRAPTAVADEAPSPGTWWVLAADHALAGELIARLEEAGREVVTVRPGAELAETGERSFTIDPRRPEHYEALREAAGGAPARILHLWSLGADDPESIEALGFYSLIYLAQALGRHGIEETAEISMLTTGVYEVERGDVVVPEKATLLGPLRVIPQEIPGLACRLVDVAEPVGEQAAAVWREIRRPSSQPVVAWRGRHRWTPTVEPLRLPAPGDGADRLRRRGVYLITGGLGGLGLGLAEHLARTESARLVLVGRTGLPPEAEWERHVADGGEAGRKIRGLRALEEAGGEVLVLGADVTDAARMRQVVEAARERFGGLDGVIHAAGVPGRGLVQLKTREAAAAVLAPKVEGTRVLAEVLADESLDFIVLFSSLASVLGGIGEVDYTAANAFLGAFAQRRAAVPGPPVVAIDWCEWQWDSWSAEGLEALGGDVRDRLRREREATGLTFEEGALALRRALAGGLSQVQVSTRPLAERLARESTLPHVLDQLEEVRDPRRRHPRPALATDYVAPRSDEEEKVAAVWQELLGIDRVGIYDDFFQLGGHSLVGTRLMSKLRDEFGVAVPLATLFEAPTVADLAAVVTAGPPAAGAAALPAITRVSEPPTAADVDGLSDQEVAAMLSEILAEREAD